MDSKPARSALSSEDDTAAAIKKLVGLFTSGKLATATLRVNLGDGRIEELVLRRGADADSARVVERIHEIITNRTH